MKAVPCSQHMQLIIQLGTDLGSMVGSNLFRGINYPLEYSSVPVASACSLSVTTEDFLVHLLFPFFLSTTTVYFSSVRKMALSEFHYVKWVSKTYYVLAYCCALGIGAECIDITSLS